MLEPSFGLAYCEERLRQRIAGRSFIGQVILSPDDQAELLRVVRERVGRDKTSRGIRLFAHEAPAVFASFLVWMGVTKYASGAYWPSVLDSLGLDGPQWERVLGEAFLRSLRELGLSIPRFDGQLKYVAPILFQGGIPDSCIASYYSHVVRYFYRNRLTSREALMLELELLRQNEIEWRENATRVRRLAEAADAFGERHRWLAKRIRMIEDLLLFSEDASTIHPGAGDLVTQGDEVLYNWDDVLSRLTRQMAADSVEIDLGIRKREAACSAIERYGALEEAILVQATAVNALNAAYAKQEGLLRAFSDLAIELKDADGLVGDIRNGALGKLRLRVDVSPRFSVADEEEVHSALDALGSVVASREGIRARIRDRGWDMADRFCLVDTAQMVDASCGSVKSSSQGRPTERALSTLWWVFTVVLAVGSCLMWLVSPAMSIAVALGSVTSGARAMTLGRARDKGNQERRQHIELLEQARRRVEELLSLLGVAPGQGDAVSNSHVVALRDLVSAFRAKASCSARMESIVEHLSGVRAEIETHLSAISSAFVRHPFWPTGSTGAECRTPSSTAMPVCLAYAVSLARTRKEEAESAKTAIAEDIDPNMTRTLHHAIHAFLLQRLGFAKLAALGGGDVQRGLSVLRSSRTSREAACRLRQELGREIGGGLDKDDRSVGILVRPDSDIELAMELEALREESLKTECAIAESESLLEEARKSGLDYVSGFGGDEPAVRFLTFGGDAAAAILTASVSLYAEHVRESRYGSATPTSSLETNVIAPDLFSYALRCHEIWKERAEDQTAPAVSLDDDDLDPEDVALVLRCERGLIAVRLPCLRRRIEDVPVSPVLTLVSGATTSVHELVALKTAEGSCTVGACEHPLPSPHRLLSIAVTAGENMLFERALDLSALVSAPTLYSPATGRPIEAIRRGESVWALLPPRWRLNDSIRVIQEERLAGAWDGFRMVYLDLTTKADEIKFVDADGVSHETSIEEQAETGVNLLGTVASFTLDDELVYLDGIPRLAIPAAVESDPSRWALTIHRLTERGGGEFQPVYSGRPLAVPSEQSYDPASEAEKPQAVALQKLVALRHEDHGERHDWGVTKYRVRLSGPRKNLYHFRFCVMPFAEVSFNPAIRPPVLESSQPLEAEFWLPDEYTLDADREGLQSEPGYATFPLGEEEDVLQCWLVHRESRWRLRQPVPRVRVCLCQPNEELLWSDRVLECWLGDLTAFLDPVLTVLVDGAEIPSGLMGTMRLSANGQMVAAPFQRIASHAAIADIPMTQFMDSLRTLSTEAAFTLALSFSAPDRNLPLTLMPACPVLRVGVLWRVHSVQCRVQMTGPDACLATLAWVENGRASNRVLALRPRSRPWSDPVEISIPDGETQVQFDMREFGLIPGMYDVRFVEEDPWQADDTLTFAPRLPNCFTQQLVPAGAFAVHSISATWKDGALRFVTKQRNIAEYGMDNPGAMGPGEVCAIDRFEHRTSRASFSVLRVNPRAPGIRFGISRKEASAMSDIHLNRSLRMELEWNEDVASDLFSSHISTERRRRVVTRTASVDPAYHIRLLEGMSRGEAIDRLPLRIDGNRMSASLSWDAGGRGICKVQGTQYVCQQCGGTFRTTTLHRRPDGRDCPSKHYAVKLYSRDLEVAVVLLWRPLSAVKDALGQRAAPHKVDLLETGVIQTWYADHPEKDWARLFQEPRADELLRALLVEEQRVLAGLERRLM